MMTRKKSEMNFPQEEQLHSGEQVTICEGFQET